MNKKKIVLIALVVILILFFIIYYLNSNKTITCEIDKDTYSNVIYINKDNFVNLDYRYSFSNIEESVNKFDMLSTYIDLIKKLDGVDANINHKKNELEYSINIDLKTIDSKDYKLLEIDKIVNLSNKEIKDYYENLSYTCN